MILLTLPFQGLATLFYGRERVALFVLNGWHGCWPWSPKEVTFYQGMTLCPGQTARAEFNVEIVPPKEGMN
jgi:hypothetical protein